MPHYEPADSFETPRFTGVRTFMRLPHVTDLDGVDFAVIGTPFDTGASYRVGARFGPAAIRAASALQRPFNAAQKIRVFDHLSGVDYGDLPTVPGQIEASYGRIVAALTPIVQAGVTPVLLGGDHSVTLAHLRAVSAVHGPLALVHFDSHSDTWDSYFGFQYNHGTPFKRAAEEGILDPAASIQIGMRGPLYDPEDLDVARTLGFEVIDGYELPTFTPEALAQRVRARVGTRPVFLTFDVDFVDPAFAPGTGTPEVGGPTSRQALDYLRALHSAGSGGLNLVGCDVVEVLPAYDHGEVTALLAATVAYELITLLALNKRDGRA